VTHKPTVLGVVTARAGSKGIPGKNTKRLAGKPLIAYTIEAALASGAFDRLILSTDAHSRAALGYRQWGVLTARRAWLTKGRWSLFVIL